MTNPEDVLKSLKISPDIVIPENVWAPEELTRENIIAARLLSRTRSGHYNVDSVNQFIRKASASINFYHSELEKKSNNIVTIAEEAAALLVQNSNLTLDNQILQNESVDKASYDIALNKIAALEEQVRALQEAQEESPEEETLAVQEEYPEEVLAVQEEAPEEENVTESLFDSEITDEDSEEEEDFSLDLDGDELMADEPDEDIFDNLTDDLAEAPEEEEEGGFEEDFQIDLSFEDEQDEGADDFSDDPFAGLDLDVEEDEDGMFNIDDFSKPEITEEEANARGIPLNRKLVRNSSLNEPLDMTMKTNVTQGDL